MNLFQYLSSLKDNSSADFASTGPKIHETSSSCQLSSEETRKSDSYFMETHDLGMRSHIKDAPRCLIPPKHHPLFSATS